MKGVGCAHPGQLRPLSLSLSPLQLSASLLHSGPAASFLLGSLGSTTTGLYILEMQEGNPRRRRAKERSQILHVRGVLPKTGALIPVSSFASLPGVFVSPLYSVGTGLRQSSPLQLMPAAFLILYYFFLPAFFSMLCHISKGLLLDTCCHINGGWAETFQLPEQGRGPNLQAPLQLCTPSRNAADHMHCWWAPWEAWPLGTSCDHLWAGPEDLWPLKPLTMAKPLTMSSIMGAFCVCPPF